MQKRNDDNIKNKNIQSIAILSFIFFIFLIIFLNTKPMSYIFYDGIFNTRNFKEQNKLFSEEINNILTSHKEKPFILYNNERKNIIAKSYVVYDVKNNKILFSKNEDIILPLASLTKIITAITAINLKSRNTIITIDQNKMRQDENLSFGLFDGQKWKLDDLLKYALTISSNASMDIIAGSIYQNNSDFVAKMNDYLKSLGFKNFYINSASGLDYGNIIGGKGTAKEYAELFSKAYQLIPDIMSYTINSKINIRSTSDIIYSVPNTNEGASKSIGLLASKTGLTDLAGGNLAIMVDFDINRPIVIVVLGSTEEGRFSDVNNLYNLVKDSIN